MTTVTGDQLAAVYTTFRTSLSSKDYDLFLSVFKSGIEDEQVLTKEEWLSSTEMVLDFSPDLADSKFIEVRQNDPYAGYYFLSDVSDQESTVINLIRFFFDGTTWKVFGRKNSISLIGQKTDEQIMNEINASSSFLLPANA